MNSKERSVEMTFTLAWYIIQTTDYSVKTQDKTMNSVSSLDATSRCCGTHIAPWPLKYMSVCVALKVYEL